MTDDSSTDPADIDELFGANDDPPAKFDGTVAEFEDAVGDLTGPDLASYADGTRDPRAGIIKAATAELERRAAPEPQAADDAEDAPQGDDTAVRIRSVDWECECGNRNTHDLARCGKCRKPRYR